MASVGFLKRISGIPFVRGFTIILLLAAAVLAVAPTVVSKTSLSGWLIARFTKDLPITVSVGNLSLGWFSPIIVDDIVIRDTDGVTLAQASRIQSESTLLNIVYSRADLGKIVVQRPAIDVVFVGDTSNIEEVIRRWPKAEPKPATRRGWDAPSFAVEVEDGTVRIVDAARKKEMALAKLGARFEHVALAGSALRGSAAGFVTGDGEPGSIEVQLSGNVSTSPQGQLTAKFQSIPASLGELWLSRGLPDLRCTGRLRGEVGARWLVAQDGTPAFQMKANVNGKNLEAQGGPLGRDRLAVRDLVMPLDIEYNGTHLTVKQAHANWEMGRASVSGKFALNRPINENASEPDLSLSFDLDLAGLAAQLPETIRLHPDLTLNSGRVVFEAKSTALNNGALWKGKLTTTDLRATRGGEPINWAEPISLSFIVRQMPKSLPDIAEIKCKAKFMSVEGVGSTTKMRINAGADLGQLAAQLGQFVDIGSWGLGGQIDATIVMQRPANAIEVQATAGLTRFQWGPWREDKLDLRGEWKVQTEGDRRTVDKSSHLRIASGADVLEVTLRDPLVIAKTGQQSGSVYAKLDGDLGRWQQRLRPVIGVLDGIALKGQANGEAWVVLSPKKIDVQSIVLTANDAAVSVGGLNIHDPSLKLQASLNYIPEQNVVEIKASQITGQDLVMHTNGLRIDLGNKTLEGTVVYGGDLERVQSWFGPPTPGGDVWLGKFDGKAVLASTAESFDVNLTGQLRDATYGPPKSPRFSDPKIQFSAKGLYTSKQNTLAFEKIQVLAKLGTIDAKAKLTKLDSTMNLDVSGSMSYDLAMIEPMAKSYLGASAKLKGSHHRDFQVSGPLRPKGTLPGAAIEIAALQGAAGITWQQIVAYGAQIGPADLNATLQAGSLRFEPLTASINEGKLKLSASMRLDAPTRDLIVPAGPVVERAKITKEMCAGALGYTLPLIANVATAEGEMSLTLAGARVPLGEAAKSDVQGVLKMHHAKVGPSPIIAQLAGLFKTVAPFSFIRENEVKFKLEKGRVYHENLELILSDSMSVKSSGSVGLDGSLSMMAEMPLPPNFLGLKIPPALAKIPVRLPISGTVDHPRIDSRGLEDVIRQAGRDAVGGIVEDRLKKLFGPK